MLRYWSHCLFPEIHCLTTKRDVGIDVVVRCFDNVSHDFAFLGRTRGPPVILRYYSFADNDFTNPLFRGIDSNTFIATHYPLKVVRLVVKHPCYFKLLVPMPTWLTWQARLDRVGHPTNLFDFIEDTTHFKDIPCGSIVNTIASRTNFLLSFGCSDHFFATTAAVAYGAVFKIKAV